MPDRVGDRSMLTALQALRFFAATSVVLYHGIHYALVQHILSREFISESPNVLSSGVPVFFALSGFLMAKLSEKASPARFTIHRILRIYPAYIAAVFLTVALKLALLGSIPMAPNIESLSLLPLGNIEYTLGVEWTLVYEIFFYIVATGLCALPSNAWRIAFAVVWLGAIIGANECISYSFTTMQPTLVQIPFSYLNVTFIAGMVCWWCRPWFEGFALLLCMLGLSLIYASSWISPDLHWLMRHFANLSGAAALVAALSTDRANQLFSRRSSVVSLGNGSYGIYLLHVPIITVLFATSPPGCMTVVVGIAASIGIGAIFGLAEFRLYSILVRSIDRVHLTRLQAPAPLPGS